MKLQDQVTASPSSAVLHILSWCWSQWLHRVISWSLQKLQITPINHVGFLSLKFAGCIKSQGVLQNRRGDGRYLHGLTVVSRAYTTANHVPCNFIHEYILEQNLKQTDCILYWETGRWWFHLRDDLLWTWNKLPCNFRIFKW
jgi:anaerobic selenocysteine-containing dehydrogenase